MVNQKTIVIFMTIPRQHHYSFVRVPAITVGTTVPRCQRLCASIMPFHGAKSINSMLIATIIQATHRPGHTAQSHDQNDKYPTCSAYSTKQSAVQILNKLLLLGSSLSSLNTRIGA
ncbi:hypothetical protein HBI63_037650 [Parastagonospora nodorum]|nr:hypothetical protein HBH84_186130 [Parastagonospora nodorum]KAH4626568.1 hypothetical protein HBH81_182850 [Parastagonospora nodorum]KAH6163699.1 hypothetical protein HBI63_037650 [Parastagonospora nodorum]KAH6183449.1 hypothetical protein HBI61_070800 [Parastagonospora nodorum]